MIENLTGRPKIRTVDCTQSSSSKMVASAVFITDTKGKVIVSRNYRGDIPMSVIERFVDFVVRKAPTLYFATSGSLYTFKKRMRWNFDLCSQMMELHLSI